MNARVFLPLILWCVAAVSQTARAERFKFQAYDGEPGKTPLSEMMFQINPLNGGSRTVFVRLGEQVEGTIWRVVNFDFKEISASLTGTGKAIDVSELTLEHVNTKRKVVLIFNHAIDVPE